MYTHIHSKSIYLSIYLSIDLSISVYISIYACLVITCACTSASQPGLLDAPTGDFAFAEPGRAARPPSRDLKKVIM